jgi:hypothetical protein
MFHFEDSVHFPFKYIILIWFCNAAVKCLQPSFCVPLVIITKSVLQGREEKVPKLKQLVSAAHYIHYLLLCFIFPL